MGYSATMASVLSAPPVIFSVLLSMLASWVSDRYRIRSPLIILGAIVTIVGIMLVAFHPSHAVQYVGLFVGYAGCLSNVPSILAYQCNNIRSQSKRSVGSALQVGFATIGGILASTVFRQQDAPRYIPGMWTSAVLQVFIIFGMVITSIHFKRRNKQVENGTVKKPIEGLVGFKYTV